MTDPHPLTDEKCNKLSIFDLDECSAAYAYGIMADMRAAADWQLEQVTKWLKATKSTVKICPSILADQIEQAMRPQEDNS